MSLQQPTPASELTCAVRRRRLFRWLSLSCIGFSFLHLLWPISLRATRAKNHVLREDRQHSGSQLLMLFRIYLQKELPLCVRLSHVLYPSCFFVIGHQPLFLVHFLQMIYSVDIRWYRHRFWKGRDVYALFRVHVNVWHIWLKVHAFCFRQRVNTIRSRTPNLYSDLSFTILFEQRVLQSSWRSCVHSRDVHGSLFWRSATLHTVSDLVWENGIPSMKFYQRPRWAVTPLLYTCTTDKTVRGGRDSFLHYTLYLLQCFVLSLPYVYQSRSASV